LFGEIKKPVIPINRDESACMYTDYFRMSEPPFSLTPDPRFLFMSERHREGLAHLVYGVQQPGGFVQLTGEIGSGKTTLSRCLVRQLPAETDVALILNPRLTAVELLATVCDELRIRYPADTQSIKVLIDALNDHLLEAHARQRRTVLIIDEAQNLSSDVLEQIRLLTNLETSQQKLLQIILIGQPELLALLKRKELRQLAQRITARYHLLSLSRPETYAYIQHRLFVAGRREPLFTAGAMRRVYRLSGGVPRLINAICDRALLGAYALDKRRVTAGIVRHASREARGFIPWHRKLRIAGIAGAIAGVALAATAIFWHRGNPSPAPREASAVHRAESVAEDQKSAGVLESSASIPGGLKMDPSSPIKPEPLAKMREPEAPAPPVAGDAQLASLLADPSRGMLSSSFSDLFARWGMKSPLNPGELGCKAAQARGFGCLFLSGSWPKLRRYDVPAILEIVLPSGARKRATLVGLSGDKATLAIAGREYTFPLSEVERVWDGSFIVLWKPPFPVRELVPGTRGDEVVWLRRALDTLDKKDPAPAVSDLYDDELRKRILAFQREHSLILDGFAGSETLVRLTLALEGPKAPSLSRGTR